MNVPSVALSIIYTTISHIQYTALLRSSIPVLQTTILSLCNWIRPLIVSTGLPLHC